MKLFVDLNSHQHLYLSEIAEPEVNVLRLVITEGQIRSDDGPRHGEASEYGAIVADDRCAAYEVLFPSYVAYVVRNESFTVVDEAEHFEGKLFRLYSRSKFLEHVSVATIASEEYGGAYNHYAFVCEDHIVDVASSEEPEITLLRNSKGKLHGLRGGG